MNFNIEKITNGYLTTLDGVKTFHDTPEAICGHMAEHILKHCEQLDASAKVSWPAQAQKVMQAQVLGQLHGAATPPAIVAPPHLGQLLAEWDPPAKLSPLERAKRWLTID
jgi:hypothetical protein